MYGNMLSRYSEPIYAAMRIVAGLLFACHGASKLFGFFGDKGPTSDPTMIFAGAIEFFGGGMIALGLYAGIAAFLSSGLMAFAYFMVHAGKGLFPIENKGELAVVYCFLFLYISAHGSGAFSLDRIIQKNRSSDHRK